MAYGFIERFKAPYTTITFGGTQAITKVGTIPESSTNRRTISGAATTLGKYAVFGGGWTTTTNSSSQRENIVFAVDTDGLILKFPGMHSARDSVAAATVKNMSSAIGDAVLFAGGGTTGNVSLNTVEVYYQNFMHDEDTLTLPNAAYALTGVTFGDYALFAGGTNGSTRFASAVAFSADWTRTILSDLDAAGDNIGGACNSNYAIFAGGWNSSGFVSSATAYDSTLTKVTPLPPSLSVARNNIAAGTAGDYALFVGGETGSNSATNVAEAYDKNLNKVSAYNYTWALRLASATSLGSYLLIMGGMGNANYYNIARYYDSNLVLHETSGLTHLSIRGSAASAGEYAYYYGGVDNYGTQYGTIEIYHLPNKVTVYPGTKYKLGSMANEVTASSMQTITTEAPISGYIKIKNANLP